MKNIISIVVMIIFAISIGILSFLTYNISEKVSKIESKIEKKPVFKTENETCRKACSIYCLTYGCVPVDYKIIDGKCYCKIRSETVLGNRMYRITSWTNLGVIENVEEILIVNASGK